MITKKDLCLFDSIFNNKWNFLIISSLLSEEKRFSTIKKDIKEISDENKIIEGEDFYFTPEGYKCFTEKYHLKRGYCCKNGCRHCPYGFDKKTGIIKK